MLGENIRTARKAKGLSQQELAVQLNVVRQTISKWEQGLSVPDSDMLLALSEALEMPVSALLGEGLALSEAEKLKTISAKLEVINWQIANRKAAERKILHWGCIALCLMLLVIFGFLLVMESSYLDWNLYDPETAVLATAMHIFEWLFVRGAPIIFFASGAGAIMTRDT